MGASASCGAVTSGRKREVTESDGSLEATVCLVMPLSWQKVRQSSKFHLIFNLLLSTKVREAVERVVQAKMGLEVTGFRISPATGANGGQMQTTTLRNMRNGLMEYHHTFLTIEQLPNDPQGARIVRKWTSVDRSNTEYTHSPEDLKGSGWYFQEHEIRLDTDEDGNIVTTLRWGALERGDRYPGTARDFARLLPLLRQGQQEAVGAIKSMFTVWAISRKDCPPKLTKESAWGTMRNVIKVAQLVKVPDSSDPVQSFSAADQPSDLKLAMVG